VIDWDLMYELECDGCGPVIGVTIRGHVEDDVAVPVAWAALADEAENEDVDVAIGRPRRLWLRKTPRRDSWGDACGSRYGFLDGPARGATPVTVVEFADLLPHPCEATR